MHFTAVFAAATVILSSTAHAHGQTPGKPKLLGLHAVQDLRARGLLSARAPRQDYYDQRRSQQNAKARDGRRGVKQARQNIDGQCGAGFGSCAPGYCCSPSGWCGVGSDYCAAPGCQFNYGPACDSNIIPPGSSTSSVPRTKLGKVSYGGVGVYDCVTPGTVALTYDDGPSIYTSQVLDVLKKYNTSATFFITGNNLGKGEIDNAAYPWAALIQRMYAEGHQIASHTWSHQDLGAAAAGQGQDVLTQQQRLNQMYYNEMAFRNILGFFPTYMRPPYSDCDAASGCEADMATLGYHVIYFDLDTEDYLMDAPNLIQTSKDIFLSTLSSTTPANGDWLVIGHDIHYQTAYNLTEYMVQTLLAQGYRPVTVGQCLGDPATNWYRNATGGSVFTSSPPSSTTTSSAPSSTASILSPDGSCGGTTGYTCAGTSFGNCCSPSGWCGSSSSYCGTGCQAGFGLCGTQSLSGSPTSSAAVSPTSISTDGTCGGSTGFTCQGSSFGNCCSPAGWCGSDNTHCGTGCQPIFGTCPGSSSGTATATSSGPAASSTLTVSTDGTCGGTTGNTCLASTFGNCCSQSGYCGSGTAYCSNGCQTIFGSCGT